MAESVRLMIKGTFTGESGLPASAVADQVIDAIRADRFWVLTHPSERAAFEARATGILSAFPPFT
jgi:hypothetical protein